MAVTVTTSPAAEPVTLDEAKAHLRVDFDDEDALITGLIAAARSVVENFTGLKLITQTVLVTEDQFPAALRLPVWPVQSVASVRYLADDGTLTTLDASLWSLVKSRVPWRVVPAYGETWPTVRPYFDAVQVSVVCGFGASGASVPADLVAAVKLILGSLYEERRGEVVGVSVAELPMGARSLMLPHVFVVP